ncbi:MAG: diguanylate cyclase, partial [Selenomonadaceae bacterium]|nr:diguanylate cyclase [Selenomonadaceae bacterium]
MPRNLSAWPDSVINLAVMLVLIAVLIHYNKFLGACALIVWALLIFFAYERRKCREKQFKEYCENVIGNINDMMYYAMTQLPEGIVVVDGDGRLQWCNEVMQGFSAVTFQQGMYVAEFWDGLISDEILNLTPDGTEPAPEEGEYKVTARRHRETADGTIEEFDRHFLVKYRHLQANEDYPRMVVLFAHEITLYEELKVEYRQSRTALIYVQVDNYDEVTQGLNETEKTALMLSVSAILETWVAELSGFLRRVADDMFIVILERQALERAIEEKFTVLDKVRQLVNKKQIQVTLSMGAAVAEKNSSEQNISEVAEKAQAGLDLALGRGGDQVAVRMDDRTQFFGGRAKAVEKNTRVKARVTAKSIRDTMESSDVVFVMGHIREDYDAFGAAVGVALMAKKLGKPVYVVLSGWNDSIEKILKPFSKAEEYQGMFIREADISISSALEPMVVVVDTFIPTLVAVPSLLERVKKVVVID